MAGHPPKPSKPRGEIAELTASLQSLCTAGKNQAKRDVFRRVINYLTVGMDMSSLFPSMTSCANLSPDDLVLKKMLYLYIAHYATQTPDLALLTINQLLKDCVDQDPLVRGLALRSLCSLRLPNFLEYVTSPVLQGLSDRHPYVRRTAVMGVLKIYHVDKAVEHTGMLDTVRQMLQSDTDPQVVANCLTVMLQVIGAEALLDKPLMYHLINKLKELSEWSQVQVLELAGQYSASGEAEVYDLLNAMEDRLAAPNSAVALAATKAFLHLTLSMPATHQQVLERIKEPLKSVIGRDEPAITYAVLANVLLLAQRAPIIFEADYATFYCRAHDPWYIKKLKMEILSALASSSNVYEVVTELTEYARDVVHPNMAREAVRAVGRIALAVPDVAGIVERLLIFLESGCEAVVSEALVVMKDLLRRFPEMAEVVVAQVMNAVTQGQGGQTGILSAVSGLTEPQARAALLWILGQFGQHIPEAPYLMEQLLDGFVGEEPSVKTAFLTAAAQLFFKRPPECQALLGQALAAGLSDSNQDVHDRALCYYRLLRVNIAEAERIINPPLQAVMAFSEALTPEMKDTIFKEFNTLSVIYQVPAATFLDQAGTYHPLGDSQEHAGVMLGEQAAPVDNSTNLLADDGAMGAGGRSQPGHNSEVDLLDMDLLGGSGAADTGAAASLNRPGISLDHVPLTGSTAPLVQPPAVASGLDALDMLGMPAPAIGNGTAQQPMFDAGLLGSYTPAAPAAAATGSAMAGLDLDDMFLGGAAPARTVPQQATQSVVLELDPQARLQPKAFQDKWKTLPVAETQTRTLSRATINAMAANNHKDFCTHLTQAYLQTIASGGQPPVYKYYFYGVSKSGQAGLVELLVSTQDFNATATFKSELGSLTNQFIQLFNNCVAGFER